MKKQLLNLSSIVFSSLTLIGMGVKATEANAAISQPTVQPTIYEAITDGNRPIAQSQANTTLSQDDADQSIVSYANLYCQTYTDGYSVVVCCIDAYGNWACVTR